MLENLDVFMPWIIAGISLLCLLVLIAYSSNVQEERRLSEITSSDGPGGHGKQRMATVGGAKVAVVPNRIVTMAARRMRKEEQKLDLRTRLAQAGVYNRAAAHLFLVARLVLTVAPLVLGYLFGQMGYVSPKTGLILGAIAGILGTFLPYFVMRLAKQSRQTQVRRALPDALDVLVVCLEGGISVNAAFARVSRELVTAHRLLALEFQIVEKQSQMGRTMGESVREFAKRIDIEELRSMASVILQAERMGSSLVEAMTVYADTMREKRFQQAEEKAQKAIVKLLFPTLLFIFPGIFVVILGPALIQMYEVVIKSGLIRQFTGG